MTLFVLAVIGLTHILVDSEIMDPVDEWAKNRVPTKVHHGLFECHQCSGFWCGVLLGLLIVSFNPVMSSPADVPAASRNWIVLEALEACTGRR